MGGEKDSERITTAAFWDQFGKDESGSVECKETLTRKERLQDPVVAFANTRGGSILIGVKNRPRVIVGTEWNEESEERVQEISRAIQPPHVIETSRVFVDGMLVIILKVPPRLGSPCWS